MAPAIGHRRACFDRPLFTFCGLSVCAGLDLAAFAYSMPGWAVLRHSRRLAAGWRRHDRRERPVFLAARTGGRQLRVRQRRNGRHQSRRCLCLQRRWGPSGRWRAPAGIKSDGEGGTCSTPNQCPSHKLRLGHHISIWPASTNGEKLHGFVEFGSHLRSPSGDAARFSHLACVIRAVGPHIAIPAHGAHLDPDGLLRGLTHIYAYGSHSSPMSLGSVGYRKFSGKNFALQQEGRSGAIKVSIGVQN